MENNKVTVTLTVAEWNVVLNALGKQSYIDVAGIIQSMNEQAKDQLAPPAPPAPDAE